MHLRQRFDENKSKASSTAKQTVHIVLKDLDKQFSILKKCKNKFYWSVHEMLLIRKLTPYYMFNRRLLELDCVTLIAYFIS